MGPRTSILLVGKPGHMRDALAGLIDSLPLPETESAPVTSAAQPVNTACQPANAACLICACDCQQAVELARENPPAVILFAGETCETCAAAAFYEIRHSAPRARCLVLTETPDPQDETRFPFADAVLPIAAPFDRLKATIESLLRRRG